MGPVRRWLSILLPSVRFRPRTPIRSFRLGTRLPHLLLPLGVWGSTAFLLGALGVRIAFFGWSPSLTIPLWIAGGACVASLWVAWIAEHERFDRSLRLTAPPSAGSEIVPFVREKLGRWAGIDEERSFRRGEEAERFHGLWPGLRILPLRVAFHSSEGISFALQSLTDPARGHVVHVRLLCRAGPGIPPDRVRALLTALGEAWVRAEPGVGNAAETGPIAPLSREGPGPRGGPDSGLAAQPARSA